MAIPNIVPQGDAPRLLWVRQDWLDKLGLKQPKTIDDIEKVARAFVEQDPNGNGKADTVGLVGPISGADIMQGQGFASILSMYGAYPGYWIKDKDGQVVYGSIQPEAKEGLAKLRDWYAAGLIDKEFALRTEESELTAAGRAGMFYGPWWMPLGVQIGNSMKNDPTAHWVSLAAPVDAAGNFNTHTEPVSDSFVVVKKGVKNPEAVMLALNTTIEADWGIADDASKLDPSVGKGWWPMRFVIEPADATTRKHLMLKDVVDGKADVDTLTTEMRTVYDAIKAADFDPTKDLGAWSWYWSYLIGAAPLAQSNLNPVYDLRSTFTKTMDDKWTTLFKLEQETYLKIIVGKEPLESFDTFVENWKKLGGDKITEEVRAE
jgi:putative aldouronate transport system substrate-binding protein